MIGASRYFKKLICFGVSCWGHSEKKAMSEHYPNLHTKNFHAVQNGGIPDADADLARNQELPSLADRHFGIYVGSLSKRKNAEGVLRAAVTFLKRYPDMRFVVIGASSGVFDSFEVDIPAEVSERLEMRGQVNDPSVIYEAFSQARFLLFPSFYEASPMPPVEAMTFGCPVVSSKIPSLTERCGDAAMYCDADNQESIISAIDTIMTSEDKWRELSDAGLTKSATYSWRNQTEALLKLSGCKV